MKLLWVLLVIQCASLSHTQGIAAGVCDDWLLVSSILVFTVTIQPSGSVVTTLGGDARFQCIPTTSQDNVQWLMNSSAALLNESIELGNAVVTHVQFTGSDTVIIIAKRLSVRRIIVGCILAMNDRPTDLYVLILYVSL